MGDLIKMSWPDRLKLDGVLCHGYGILPKFAMCDSALPLTAKAIYAYFCSMSGSGDTAFPGRDTIISRLNISKQTYYKNLELLKEQGYISVRRQTNALGQFSHNIYCIEENPKKFSQRQISPQEAREGGTVSFQGVKSAGYGMIPRAVMMDARLDIKAKGIYAYFASFTGIGQAAFPEVKTILYHLHINKDTYHKHLKALIAANYISVRQRHQHGRLGINDYFLVTNPDASAPSHQQPKKQDMDKPLAAQGSYQRPKKQDTEKQPPEKQVPEKQSPAEQSPVNPDAIIPSSPITSFTNTSFFDHQSIEQTPQTSGIIQLIDRSTKKELKEMILDKLGIYDELFGGREPSAQALGIQQLVSLVVDAITIKSPTIRIGKDCRDRRDVAETLFGLTREHYIYVLQSVSKVSKPIKNPVQYRLAALYNAPATYVMGQRAEQGSNYTMGQRAEPRSNAWMKKYIQQRQRDSG